MKKYGNLGHDSGIAGYEIGPEALIIQFKDGNVYTYSNNKAGKQHVDHMKDLARLGKGLNTYLNKYVKDRHD